MEPPDTPPWNPLNAGSLRQPPPATAGCSGLLSLLPAAPCKQPGGPQSLLPERPQPHGPQLAWRPLQPRALPPARPQPPRPLQRGPGTSHGSCLPSRDPPGSFWLGVPYSSAWPKDHGSQTLRRSQLGWPGSGSAPGLSPGAASARKEPRERVPQAMTGDDDLITLFSKGGGEQRTHHVVVGAPRNHWKCMHSPRGVPGAQEALGGWGRPLQAGRQQRPLRRKRLRHRAAHACSAHEWG